MDFRQRYGKLKIMTKKPKLGSGKRFQQLEGKLKQKGAKNPGALAASIGREKYGAKKMGKLAAAGRKAHGTKK